MAPDADKLRQRKANAIEDAVANYVVNPTAPGRLVTMKSLKSTEICIDGSIYDISNFDHPGGPTIDVFGGNDVTVQYRMIHPHHTSKHLEKMKRVGKVVDYTSDYKFDTPFEREVKAEVFKIVRRGREFGTLGWYFRAFFYIGLFFALQYLWVTTPTSYLLAIIYGISQALIGLNVQHDANHGASSRKPWINAVFGLGADFIGGSKWLWMEQHWTHHSFTNHATKDPDGFASEPMVLCNDYEPGNPKRTFMHGLQGFYFIFVFAGYWISSVFNPQVLDLRHRGAQFIGMQMESEYLRRSVKFAIGLRILYILTNIVAPFVTHGGFSWNVLGHILVLGFSGSLALAIPFGVSHNFVGCDRDPTYAARQDNGGGPVCWFKSQVETSCTYGGFISGCLTGGLNFQIEHHLFPRMSSAWYPYIAPTIRKVCEKHGVKYVYYPWFIQNLVSTFSYVHSVGNGSNWKLGNPYSGEL